MAAMDFLSLDKIEEKTGIDKKIIIVGVLGVAGVIFAYNIQKGKVAQEDDGARTMEGGYDGPSNDLQQQMQMQNFMDIVAGNTEQMLNSGMAAMDDRLVAFEDEFGDQYSEQFDKINSSLEQLSDRYDKLKDQGPEENSDPKPKPKPKPDNSGGSGVSGISKKKYATPSGGWNSGSIVDTFKKKGYNASYANRKKFAKQAGISNYRGSASQNKQLIRKANSML